MNRMMKRLRWFAPTIALIAVLCFSTNVLAKSGAPAAHGARNAVESSALLTPDPWAYCAMNPPFQTQRLEADWQVAFQNVVGDAYQNDWGCQYLVQISVNFVFPPIPYTMPIDWNAMCNQQYPGATATWIPGPETGVAGAPWGCVGAPGVLYDPAEQADGTHLVVSGN